MGTVLRFPAERVRGALYPAHRPEPAAILILPVVQIKREAAPDDGPSPGFDAASGNNANNRRRRRTPRS
ncbi:MAG: hypothetical protein WD871_16310 [Xanthobacteraceae bacterium]